MTGANTVIMAQHPLIHRLFIEGDFEHFLKRGKTAGHL